MDSYSIDGSNIDSPNMVGSEKKPKILIVDDHPENLLVLEKILKKLNADVIQAASGNEALTAILYNDFALIILDVQMPEMDGYEVAEILKFDQKTEDIPIIFVTAIDRDSAKEIKGYSKGAVDFIFKPLNEFILVSKVKIFLEIYQMKSGLENLVQERTLELEKVNTDLINNNERLIKSERRYRTLFEKSNDAIFIIEKSTGRYLDANQAASQLTGRESEELKILTINDTTLEDSNKLISIISELDDTTEIGEVIYTRPHQSHRTAKLSVVPLNGDAVIGIAKDITNDLIIEKQLRQSQKMESIGTLAGGIAHDFNNILFPIVGYSEMLLSEIPKDDPMRSSLKGIYTASLRAKDLVKQILAFARHDTSEVMLLKMQPIIKESLKLIRSTIPTTIEMKNDINPDCGLIEADPTQIHQIVMNLATNAFHAMEKSGGELKVTLEEVKLEKKDLPGQDMLPGDYACFTITDSGVGMDKDLMEQIFDPFFTTKEKYKGTGMGLSVVHGIVKSMKGAISVESDPGKGTKFSVFFPMIKGASQKNNNPPSKWQLMGGHEKILIVDDEESIIQMVESMLVRLGYQVTSSSSSVKALEIFSATPDQFDLVITDMTMPDISGDKLFCEMTKIRSDIPVILCTGFYENNSERKMESIGIKNFLLKPVKMNDLAQTIRKLLD
jgi:PAS domain S-box-containing protein